MARVRVTYDEDATSTLIIYLPTQLISVDVDVGERGRASIQPRNINATSSRARIAVDVDLCESYVDWHETSVYLYPSSPASLIVVDVDICECNIATTNLNSTPIVTSISIDVDVGECSSSTFNEDSTSPGWYQLIGLNVNIYVASRDVEPDQLELARRASDPGT